jgi:uncharacterized glyoxalase superfamily protein PhnB
MESLSPNFFVKDINKTIEYYKLLGFNLVATVPEQGDFVWAMMNCGEINFMFQTMDSLGDDLPEISRNNAASLLFYINIKEIRKFHEQIKNKVHVIKELEKTFYGATEFSIQDINGYVLTFAEDE